MPQNTNDINKKLDSIKRHAGDIENQKVADPTKDRGRVVVDHMKTLADMLRIISVTPMEDHLKEIMRIRLTHTRDESSMILMKYATVHGVRLKLLLDMETEAIEKVKDYLKKSSLDDAIGEFAKDRRTHNKLKESIGKSPGILSGSKREIKNG